MIENQEKISKENHISNDIRPQDDNIIALKGIDSEIKVKNGSNLNKN